MARGAKQGRVGGSPNPAPRPGLFSAGAAPFLPFHGTVAAS